MYGVLKQGTPRWRRRLNACSVNFPSEAGSMRQNEPLPGSSWDLGTLIKYRFNDRLWRIEFCKKYNAKFFTAKNTRALHELSPEIHAHSWNYYSLQCSSNYASTFRRKYWSHDNYSLGATHGNEFAFMPDDSAVWYITVYSFETCVLLLIATFYF